MHFKLRVAYTFQCKNVSWHLKEGTPRPGMPLLALSVMSLLPHHMTPHHTTTTRQPQEKDTRHSFAATCTCTSHRTAPQDNHKTHDTSHHTTRHTIHHTTPQHMHKKNKHKTRHTSLACWHVPCTPHHTMHIILNRQRYAAFESSNGNRIET